MDPLALSDLTYSDEGPTALVPADPSPADPQAKSLPVITAAPNSSMPWSRQEDDVLVGRSRFSVRLPLRRR